MAVPCSEIDVPEIRDFTDEQIEAVKWKLNMHRSTASTVVRFMAGLTDKTVASLVVKHKSVVAEPPAPKPQKHHYILDKTPPWHVKKAALH